MAVAISTVIFVATAIYAMVESIVGGAIKAAASNKLKKMSRKLAEQVASNQQLTSKITEAYNNKNYKLMNSLLTSSPFSGTYAVLKDNANKLQAEYDKAKDIIDKDSKEIAKKQSDLANIESNINGGMISGFQGVADLDKFKDHKQSDDYKNLANGGMQLTQGDSANYGGAGAIILPKKGSN